VSPKGARISTTWRSKWTTSFKTNSTLCFSPTTTFQSTPQVSQNSRECLREAAYRITTIQAHLSLGKLNCPKMSCHKRSSSLGSCVLGNSQRKEIREGLWWKGARIRVFRVKNPKLNCNNNFSNVLCQQVIKTRILSGRITPIDRAFNRYLIRIKHPRAFLIKEIYKIRSDPTTLYNSQTCPFSKITIINWTE